MERVKQRHDLFSDAIKNGVCPNDLNKIDRLIKRATSDMLKAAQALGINGFDLMNLYNKTYLNQ